MKINDAVFGAILLLLGAAVLVTVQSFPRIPGQNVGPGLFPGLIGAGMRRAACCSPSAACATARASPGSAGCRGRARARTCRRSPTTIAAVADGFPDPSAHRYARYQ